MSGHDGVKAPGGTTFYFGTKPKAPPRERSDGITSLLAALADRVDACLEGRAVDILNLAGTDIRPEMLDDVLGAGEIKLWVHEPGFITEAVESVMPGVWHMRRRTGDGEPVEEYIDVGAFPRLVEQVMDRHSSPKLEPQSVPDDTLSAGPILQEIGHHMAGDNSHTIVLTNLPMSPRDMDVLNGILGEGPVAGGSKGYSTTRVRSTRYRRVWRVNYLNSDGQVIYDAIEIAHAPLSLAAPREDIEEGRRRLADLMRIYT